MDLTYIDPDGCKEGRYLQKMKNKGLSIIPSKGRDGDLFESSNCDLATSIFKYLQESEKT